MVPAAETLARAAAEVPVASRTAMGTALGARALDPAHSAVEAPVVLSPEPEDSEAVLVARFRWPGSAAPLRVAVGQSRLTAAAWVARAWAAQSSCAAARYR